MRNARPSKPISTSNSPIKSIRRSSLKNKAKKKGSALTSLAVLGMIVVLVGFAYTFRNVFRINKNQAMLEKTNDDKTEDDEYVQAILAKVKAEVQPGWVNITSLEATNLTINHKTNLSSIVANLSSSEQPAFVHGYSLFKEKSIFTVDLTRFSKSKTMLAATRMQHEPVFVLGHEKDKGGMLGSTHDRPLSYADITLGDFLQSTFRKQVYYYWTGELRYLAKALRQKFWMYGSIKWDELMIHEDGLNITDSDSDTNQNNTQSSSKSSENSRPMVWISHPGVVAQTHYDPQHNLFLQVLGFKRFLLFPPSTELYSYPSIHRSYRQSQVHLEEVKSIKSDCSNSGSSTTSSQSSSSSSSNIEEGVFNLIKSNTTQAFEVNLAPGDLLYIPPYWHHRVESLSLSLSVSVLSPSLAEAVLMEVYWQKVPFGELQATRVLRVRAVGLYFHELFEYLTSKGFFTGSKQSLQQFVKELLAARFEPLKLQDSISDAITALCPASISEEDQVKINEVRPKFVIAARNAGSLLMDIKAAEYAVKITFLRDYIEQLSRWAVGPQLTAQFLRVCIAE